MERHRRRALNTAAEELECRVVLSRTTFVMTLAPVQAIARPSGGAAPYLDQLFDPSGRPQAVIEGTDVGGPGDTPLPDDLGLSACFPPDDWDPNADEPNSTEPD